MLLSNLKEELEEERELAIQSALEKERSKIEHKLQKDLESAKNLINQKERQIETCNQRIQQLRQSKEVLNEKIDSLTSQKDQLESKINTDRETIEGQRVLIQDLQRELNDERLKMSQTELNSENTESENDEVRVSESKKVRLEADGNQNLSRVEHLEAVNKKLNSELKHTESLLESLEAERIRLEVELMNERSKKSFEEESSPTLTTSRDSGVHSSKEIMSASIAVVSDASSSRNRRESHHRSHHHMSKSSTNLIQQMKINFNSCNPGDVVLALWNKDHRHYTIIQETNTLYFLNSDCAGALDLSFGSDGLPTKLYIFAEVVDKEFCSARKVIWNKISNIKILGD